MPRNPAVFDLDREHPDIALDTLRQAVVELRARVEALEAGGVTRGGGRKNLGTAVAAVPGRLGGAIDVTIKWGDNLGDASYQVDIDPDPALVDAQVTVKSTHATTAVLTVTLARPLVLPAQIRATAWRAG